MEADNWTGCYEGGWNGLIVPEAFSHPAKFSYNLTQRMFEHARDKGWISPGSVVVDPFGGVGTGGIIAAYADIQWIGCELEARFCDLARENFELHRRKWEGLGSPIPIICCGDSRGLSTIVEALADVIISSPPFQEQQDGGGICKTGTPAMQKTGGGPSGTGGYRNQGSTPGQLGSMKPGDVDAIVEADLILSSPPYEGSLRDKRDVNAERVKKLTEMGNLKSAAKFKQKNDYSAYSAHPQNLGNLRATVKESLTVQNKGPTFWEAAKEIVQQCHQILKPRGHAIFVLKAFVRKGSRVDFPGDWRRLCESVGFTTVCTHHAMLVKETTDEGLFGEITEKKERKSFFRRLAESKGSPPIDYEVILCTEK